MAWTRRDVRAAVRRARRDGRADVLPGTGPVLHIDAVRADRPDGVRTGQEVPADADR
jgi:hypothetical protein